MYNFLQLGTYTYVLKRTARILLALLRRRSDPSSDRNLMHFYKPGVSSVYVQITFNFRRSSCNRFPLRNFRFRNSQNASSTELRRPVKFPSMLSIVLRSELNADENSIMLFVLRPVRVRVRRAGTIRAGVLSKSISNKRSITRN